MQIKYACQRVVQIGSICMPETFAATCVYDDRTCCNVQVRMVEIYVFLAIRTVRMAEKKS